MLGFYKPLGCLALAFTTSALWRARKRTLENFFRLVYNNASFEGNILAKYEQKYFNVQVKAILVDTFELNAVLFLIPWQVLFLLRLPSIFNELLVKLFF